MPIVSYKEYQGSVEYEDGRLVIQILHIDDTIIDEVTDASSVQSAFEGLVEDYLETCRAVGKEPCKPFKGSFNVRLTPSLHKSAARAAARSGTSLNQWVIRAIESALNVDQRRDEKAARRELDTAYSD